MIIRPYNFSSPHHLIIFSSHPLIILSWQKFLLAGSTYFFYFCRLFLTEGRVGEWKRVIPSGNVLLKMINN